MEIKEGMYARVKGRNNFPGGIAKILKIKEEKGKKWLTLDTALDYSFLVLITNVIKASHNITDLIAKDDMILSKDGKIYQCWKVFNDYVFTYSKNKQGQIITLVDYQIDKILTKEQFESMSYKVGK